jgi:hypothetical protein
MRGIRQDNDGDEALMQMTHADPVLALMRHYGIPVTRENYLELAYMGDVPELDAESEANLPVEIQRQRT